MTREEVLKFALDALADCVTSEEARAFTDESRNAAYYAKRRLDAINKTARAAIVALEAAR